MSAHFPAGNAECYSPRAPIKSSQGAEGAAEVSELLPGEWLVARRMLWQTQPADRLTCAMGSRGRPLVDVAIDGPLAFFGFFTG